MRCPRRACLTLLALAAPASAQCTPDWSDRFSHPDFERPAYATVVFDDGTGPALYAGGNFQEAGSASASLIAKWKGYKWQPVGTGLGPAAGNYKYVTTLAVHDDDGPGPHPPVLYASGNFTEPGPGIARWDGVSWTAIPNSPVASVMASIDGDGPGPLPPALYIGGTFITAGGVEASRIVRWDGQAWAALGSGLTPNGGMFTTEVRAIIRHDEDGAGPLAPRLFVGGYFGVAGGQTAYHVAAWDGQNWSPLGGGMTSAVNAFLELDEDGPGPDTPSLIATGNFTLTSGFPSNGAARWKNDAWSAMGSGPGAGAGTMVLFDADGPGPAAAQLIARQSNRLISWNGISWSPIPGTFSQGMSSSSLPPGQGLASLTVFTPLNSLPTLVVSGNFRRVGSTAVNHIAQLDGVFPWRSLQNGFGITLPGASYAFSVATLTPLDEAGSGRPVLIAGGSFIGAGSAPISGLARYATSGWTSLGDPLPTTAQVTASTIFDEDGPGPIPPALYIALSNSAGGLPEVSVARWDGASWSTLGSVTAGASTGSYSLLFALASFDEDGPGPLPPRLCAGGQNLVNESYVVRWDGAAWTPLGAAGLDLGVFTLAEFDADGPGPGLPLLYAGTLASGMTNKGFYRLEGQSWNIAGGGINGPYQRVRALAVMDDDGPGPILPALYVGGTFWSAGGISTYDIARFDGTSWTSPNGGLDPRIETGDIGAHALLPVDEDGPGPATPVLYVGGAFSEAGGIPAWRVARWNPAAASWSALGLGISNPGAFVYTLAWISNGPQAGLYAAGYLKSAGDVLSSHIAHWACGTRCYPNCDGSTSPPILNVNDFICFMNSFAAGQTFANCDQSTNPPILNVNDFTCFMNRYAAGCP